MILNQPQPFVGLGTLKYTVPSSLDGTIAYLKYDFTEVPPSGVVLTFSVESGPTIYTSPSLTPTQGALQGKVAGLVSGGIVLDVTISSSQPIDKALNNVKSIITIVAKGNKGEIWQVLIQNQRRVVAFGLGV